MSVFDGASLQMAVYTKLYRVKDITSTADVDYL